MAEFAAVQRVTMNNGEPTPVGEPLNPYGFKQRLRVGRYEVVAQNVGDFDVLVRYNTVDDQWDLFGITLAVQQSAETASHADLVAVSSS